MFSKYKECSPNETPLSSSCSKQTYSHLTDVEVNKFRRIVSHKASKVSTYEAVPSAKRNFLL